MDEGSSRLMTMLVLASISDTSAIVQSAVGVASLAVAVTAIWLAKRVDDRASERSRAEHDLSRMIAAASVRPLLSIDVSTFLDKKSIRIVNNGLGPAVVKQLQIRKQSSSTGLIVELMNFSRPFTWEYFTYHADDREVFLAAGTSMELVRQSLEHLVAQGIPDAEARDILERQWFSELAGVSVAVEYTDLYSYRHETVRRSDWLPRHRIVVADLDSE